MNNNSDKIFRIEKTKSHSSEDKLSLLQKNIAILSSMNQLNEPNSVSSLFPTSTAFHYTNQSFLNIKENSFDYSFKQEHYTNSSFLLFPMFHDDDINNVGMSFFTSESFKNEKMTQNSFFNEKKKEDVIISKPQEKKNKIKKKSIKRRNSKRIYKCEHMNCPLTFKTIKQKYNHHKKMCKECKKDTITMLKGINRLKLIYHGMRNKKEISQSLRDKYSEVMHSKYLEGYAQLFVGLSIDESINDTEMNINISSDYEKDI